MRVEKPAPVILLGIGGADPAWADYADELLPVERGPGMLADLAELLPERGPFWALLVEEGEVPRGDPAIFRRELDRAERHVLEPLTDGELGEPLHCIFHISGLDWAEQSVVDRMLYCPAGQRWEDEWRWAYMLETKARVQRTDRRGMHVLITPYVLEIESTLSIFQPPLSTMRAEVLRSICREALRPDERAHYNRVEARGAVAARPVLSLCVIFKDVDEKLLAMLASTRGQVDEYILVATAPSEGWTDRIPEDLGAPFVLSDYECPRPVTLPDGTTSIGDFSAARQFAFDLATGTWRMFLDSDDTLEWAGDDAKPCLSEALVRHSELKQANRIALSYQYQPGVTQARMCIWKWLDMAGRPMWQWDGCPVHERVVATAWLDGERTIDLKLPGDVFYVQHHAEDTVDSSWRRNYLIAKRALEEGSAGPEAEPRLLYTVGTYLMETKDPHGETILRQLIDVYLREPYAMNAALDLARNLLEDGRWREVPALLAPLVDVWGAEPELHLLMARARTAGGAPDAALQWYNTAYQPRGDRPEYRTMRDDLEHFGRLEAVKALTEARQFATAAKVVKGAPPDVRKRPEFDQAWHDLMVAEARVRAAQGALALGHFLLTVDCVDKARDVYDALPLDVLRSPEGAELSAALERRERHLVEPEDYEATYAPLNEADLVTGARNHMPPVLARILEHKPALFVDIGCNTGWMAMQVARQLPECLVLGMDAGWARVDECRERAKRMGLPAGRVRFVQHLDGNWRDVIRDVPLEIGVGPVIVHCSEVLEHVPDAEEFLATIAEGADRLMLTVPDLESYHDLVPRARRMDLGLREASPTARQGGEHVRCFTAHELVDAVLEVGFEPVRVERLSLWQRPEVEDRQLLFVDCAPLPECDCDDDCDGDCCDVGRVDILAKGFVPWGPRTHLERHVGGSEQAVAHLAPELAALGFEVHVYGEPFDRQEYERGVYWHHADEFRAEELRDCCIVWRQPEDLRRIVEAARGRWKTVLWCHDTPDRIPLVLAADEVWLLSEYQRDLYVAAGVPAAKTRVLQNGVNRAAIESALRKTEHVRRGDGWQKAVFWGSSADRGLLHLLRMWPAVRAAEPEAELFATYRQDLLRHPAAGAVKAQIADEVERLAKELEPQGVHFFDGLNHNDYLCLAATCGIWAGCSNFDEISCIVAMEVQALGLDVVATDRAALAETVLDHPLCEKVPWGTVEAEIVEKGARIVGGAWWLPEGCYSETYLQALLAALSDAQEVQISERNDLILKALRRYDWKRTAEMFKAAIEAGRGE